MRKARGFHLLGTGVVVVSGLALSCGRVAEPAQHLEVSSPKVHEAHGAPNEEGDCPHELAAPAEWMTEFDAPGLAEADVTVGNVALAMDSCGNVALAWDDVAPQDTGGEVFPTVARLFPDGELDWTRRRAYGPDDLGYVGGPVHVADLKFDAFGNVLLLTPSWLQVFTPGGDAYPGMGQPLTTVQGLFLEEYPSGWLASGPVHQVFELPSGRLLESRDGEPGMPGLTVDYYRFKSDLLFVSERTYRLALQESKAVPYIAGAQPDGSYLEGYHRLVTEIVPTLPDEDGVISSVNTGLVDEFGEFRTVGGRLARKDDKTFYAYSELEYETLDCRAAVLKIIEDPSWEADLPMCGVPMKVLVLPDGSSLSFWVAAVDVPAGDQRIGAPTLVQLKADGSQLRTWDLREQLGLVSYPTEGLPRNLAMSLTLDPNYVLLAAASREHGQVRVMQLRLDDD